MSIFNKSPNEVGIYYKFSNGPVVLDGRKQKLPKIVYAKTESHRKKSDKKQEFRKYSALLNVTAKEVLKTSGFTAPYAKQFEEAPIKQYLEEIKDIPEDKDVMCQTDMWIDENPIAVYIPAKIGVDASTQIEKLDIFDFNIEVKPILEVLVGKTVEQSLLEVSMEEELYSLREQQRIFEELRNSDLAELQRLEDQDLRIRVEKQNRLNQIAHAMKLEQETKEKIAARNCSVRFLKDLVPHCFAHLNTQGYMYDPIERDIEEGFFKEYIVPQVQDGVNSYLLSRNILDNMIKEVVFSKKGKFAELERSAAEWKMVETMIDKVHEKVSWLAVDDCTALAETMLDISMRALRILEEKAVKYVFDKAVEQYALKIAAARAAEFAASEVEDGEQN